jgi:hypothetical protein
MIRHITAADNVFEGRLLDPAKTRHGIITAMRLSDLSGWVDSSTHLNFDLPGHLMQSAVVAESLELGARVREKDGMIVYAFVDPSAFRHFGFIDTVRRADLLREAITSRRNTGRC